MNEVDYSTAIIQDQVIRGIADKKILADLLGDDKTDRSLDQIVDYIARKEQAKLEHGVVTTNHCNNAALQSKIERICTAGNVMGKIKQSSQTKRMSS